MFLDVEQKRKKKYFLLRAYLFALKYIGIEYIEILSEIKSTK